MACVLYSTGIVTFNDLYVCAVYCRGGAARVYAAHDERRLQCDCRRKRRYSLTVACTAVYSYIVK